MDPHGCFGGKKLNDFEAQGIIRYRAATPRVPDNNIIADNDPLLPFNGEELNRQKEATSKEAAWEAFMDEWDDLMDRVAEQDHSESEELLRHVAQKHIDQEQFKEMEQEQPNQASSAPQVSEAAEDVHGNVAFASGQPEESEQELEGDSELPLDYFQIADDEPEESNRGEPEQGKQEIDIGQAADVAAPSHGAGDGQKVLFSDQNPTTGPAFFPSKPAYVSPYAIVQDAQPMESTAGVTSINNQLAPQSAPQAATPTASQPALQAAYQPASRAASHPAPQVAPPKPRHKRMAKHLRTSRAAATALGLPTPPSWAAFIRPSPASAANPAGYAAAHELIARTPFKTQCKRTIAITGQEKGDFCGVVRNQFINNYLRLVHPNRSVFTSHGQKNQWFDTLPPQEQYEVRVFVMQQVEAKLPDDVATEVERLRNVAPRMAVGGGPSLGLSAGPRTGMNGGMNGVGYSMGGLNRPTIGTCGVKDRQVVGGNAGVNGQNVPEARMQDLGDLGQQSRPANQFENGTANGTVSPYRSESSLFPSPFGDSAPPTSIQPRLGTGYYPNQRPYPRVSNPGVYPYQAQPSTVVGDSDADAGDSIGYTYPLPPQKVHSQHFGRQSVYQGPENSLYHSSWDTTFGGSNLLSQYGGARAGDTTSSQNFDPAHQYRTEISDGRSANGIGSDSTGVPQTGSTLRGRKRKSAYEDDDDLVDDGLGAKRYRRT